DVELHNPHVECVQITLLIFPGTRIVSPDWTRRVIAASPSRRANSAHGCKQFAGCHIEANLTQRRIGVSNVKGERLALSAKNARHPSACGGKMAIFSLP